MKKGQLITLGIDNDRAKRIMRLHGKNITKLHAKVAIAEDSLNEKNKELINMKLKFDELKLITEKKMIDQEKVYLIRIALAQESVFDEEIVISQLNTDAINIINGKLNGLTEQLAQLRKNKKFLFKHENNLEATPQIFASNCKRKNYLS